MKLEFESIETPRFGMYIARAKVPGGWLVTCTQDVNTQLPERGITGQGYEWRTSITFVPDPNHEWKEDTE